MQIETWYFLKETNGVLEDFKIHEVYMYKEDGRYTKLLVEVHEEGSEGYQSICDFPYRLYKERSQAMNKFRNIRWTSDNYKPRKHLKSDEVGGFLQEYTTVNYVKLDRLSDEENYDFGEDE